MQLKKLLLYFLILITPGSLLAQELKGKVISAKDSLALPGAVVKLKKQGWGTLSDSEGRFTVPLSGSNDTLVISYIGFISQEIPVFSIGRVPLEIVLSEQASELTEVVATGYQFIPKDRATGSFVHVDEKLLNRRVGSNLLERLEDITPGLVFNRNPGSTPNSISIRGQSTLFGNARPLIVIDNFPYEGNIANINPNDVESITVLKDAAAASIWGTRAANGVIVVTTKQGRVSQGIKATFNTNVQIREKPDLFYQPKMAVSDFIEMEKSLFAKGYYQATEQSLNRLPLTPVVELLVAQRAGLISAEQVQTQIGQLSQNDLRKDFERYFYRNSVSQQYALSLTGGSKFHSFTASAGLDDELASLRGNQNRRATLSFSNTFDLLKNKVQASVGIYYTGIRQRNDNPGPASYAMSTINGSAPLYPYATLLDASGKPSSIARNYRSSFVRSAQDQGLLDWGFRPLEEIDLADNTTRSIDYRFNAGLVYKVLKDVKLETRYQTGASTTRSRNLQSQDTYFTRDLINRFTQLNPETGLQRSVPAGGILDESESTSGYSSLRLQMSYDKTWNNQAQLTALGGTEIRTYQQDNKSSRLYGYDDRYATSKPVDYISAFSSFVNPASTNTIPNINAMGSLTDHYLSYYSNVSYTHQNRYTISGSGRLDQSNLFGVDANQKGVPLWSAGVSWTLSKEPFYKLKAVPYLKARFTYGYNGNINKSISAFTTARFASSPDFKTQLPYLTIVNPPNPALKWERVRMWNAGLDFECFSARLGGSIEYFNKHAIDLIGNISLAPSNGIQTYTGNTAAIKGKGVDIVINSENVKGKLRWNSNFFFSWVTEKVQDYPVLTSAGTYITNGAGIGIYPLEGRPLYAQYSYSWAGLEAETGDPLGYLDGVPSKNYSRVMSSTTTENMQYHGPARPVVFGALRNTISWKSISLSFNISYRTGYYFRRTSVSYSSILRGEGGHGDYTNRWQAPGDELHTDIPSMPQAINTSRDSFYISSGALVEKADHIRLQDCHLSFDLDKNHLKKLPFTNTQLYMYANNLGLLWKANIKGLDPDYHLNGPVPRSYSIGLKFNI